MGVSLTGSGVAFSGGGGGGASAVEVVYDPAIVDPIPVLYVTPAFKTSTTASNVAAIQALTAGVLTVDGVSTAPVDFSGVPNGDAGLSPINVLLNAAIDLVPALDGYAMSVDFISNLFHFRLRNFGGDVGVLSGNLVTAMGLDAVTEGSFTPRTSPLIIAPPVSGYWRELRFWSTLELRGNSSTFKSTFTSDGTDTYSWVSALSSRSAWREEVNSNTANGLYNIGKALYFSSTYSDFMYDPITGEITWDAKIVGLVPTPTLPWKMTSLFVLGERGR